METSRNLNADICRIQNYLEAKIRAPMDVEEQKALCNLVLHLLAKDSDSN